MLIEVDRSVQGIKAHEREIIKGRLAPMLLPVTLVATESPREGTGTSPSHPDAYTSGDKIVRRERLIYSAEGFVPLASFSPGRDMSLNDLFMILESYIRGLMSARDMLLDERLISSDTAKGVFVRGRSVRAIWGAGAKEEAHIKICRVAKCLSEKERIVGASSSMERVIDALSDGKNGLGQSLKAVESCHREWNYII